MNIDVLSFKRLAYRVFDELGITRLTVLEETGKNLVLRKLAGQEADKLGVIGRNLNRIGYISEVKSLLSELVQYNISPQDLEKYIASGRLSDTLSGKLKDVLVLYEAFEKFMQDKYITAEEILNVLCDVAEESAILRNSVIAFDEFQIIRNFKDVNMEALLRTYIQPLKNVRFVFCGSQKHIMTDMFVNEKSPFYESTHVVYLDKIQPDIYGAFIRKLFGMGSRRIDDDALEFILEWTRCHTFYVQYLCHRLFRDGGKKITLSDVRLSCAEILREGMNGFLERRNLLTDKQWQFLKAVAKEGSVVQPTAGSFLNKYKLGTAAAVKRIVTSLVEKELLLETLSLKGKNYCVYNVFLSRWLESV